MRRNVALCVLLFAIVSMPAAAQIASISGSLDAQMDRNTSKSFAVTITAGSNGYHGALEALIDSSSGLSVTNVIVSPAVLTCGTELRGFGRNFVDCAGTANLSAGQQIQMQITIFALNDFGTSSKQDWSVELAGDFLSGADVKSGAITLTDVSKSRVVVAALPSFRLEPVGVSDSTNVVFQNKGNADGFGSVQSSSPLVTIDASPLPVGAQSNASRDISIKPNNTPGNYNVSFTATDDNGPHTYTLRIEVQAQPSGSPKPQPSSSRVDVRAPINCSSAGFVVTATCTNPSFDVALTNTGTGQLIGGFSSSSSFVVAPTDSVSLAPNETRTYTGSIDMTQLPPTAGGGSVSAPLTFTYLVGSGGNFVIEPNDGGSGTGTITITIVTSVPPGNTSTGAIPKLASRCQTGLGCWDESALFVAGVGHVVGSVGQFISDLTIYPGVGFGQNPSLRSLSNLDLYFTPLGTSTTQATKVTVAGVSPPGAASFGDVVSTVYGATQQLGSLQVRAPGFQPDEIINMNVNVFNVSNKAGTYGTTLPVFASYNGITGSNKEFLAGLRKDATSHTNIYVQEVLGSDTSANIDFYNAGGTKIGSTNVPVGAFAAAQIGGGTIPSGTVSAVVSNGGGGAIHAYATPVDDASGDTWAVADWSRVFHYEPSNFFPKDRNKIIPVAGALHGANNTYFRTDVVIMNTGTTSSTGTLTYYNRTGEVTTKPITLAVNETRVLDDVATNFFGITTDSVGWIFYTTTTGNTAITARNYTTSPGSAATFGTALPTVDGATTNSIGGSTSGFGIRKGRVQRIAGIDDAARSTITAGQPGSFRTSMGLVEVAGKSATVEARIYYNVQTVKTSTTDSAASTFTLSPHQFVLIGSFTEAILGSKRASLGDLHNVTIEFTVLDGDGTVVPFVTSVDNGTGDSTFRVN